MWGPVSKSLQAAGSMTLCCDYRQGHARDQSGLGRDGTFPAGLVTFGRNGASFTGAGLISHPDHVNGRNTTGSVVLLLKPDEFNTGTYFCAEDAGGRRIRIGVLGLVTAYGLVADASYAFTVTTIGTNCIGVNYATGNPATSYRNGVYHGVAAGGSPVITANDAPIIIGNYFSGSSFVAKIAIACVLETNVQLTSNQHAAVFAEMSAQRYPTKSRRNVWANSTRLSGREPGLLASYDLAGPVAIDKTGVANGVITGTTPDIGPGGMPALRFRGSVDTVVTTTTYTSGARTFSWWAKSNLTTSNFVFSHNYPVWAFVFNGDGTKPLLLSKADGTHYRYWLDSPAQDDGQWHHWVLTCTVGVDDATLYCDGVALTVWSTNGSGFGSAWGPLTLSRAGLFNGSLADFRVYNTAFTAQQVTDFRRNTYSLLAVSSSDFGSPVSTAIRGGVADSELETTGWRFGNTVGRYKVSTSTVEGRVVKTLECTTAGGIYYPTAQTNQTQQEAAYGTWEFAISPTLATNQTICLVANMPTYYTTAGFNGYLLFMPNSASVKAPAFYVVTNGTAGVNSPLAFLQAGVFSFIRVTRSASGVWMFYYKQLPSANWVYAGTFTNNAHSVSAHMVAFLGAGDLVSLGAVNGEMGIVHSVMPT